jgi:uncharacterized RDD family membrane protein YckC
MQTIRVRTTQNVFIEYPLASVGERIVAYLIDGLFWSFTPLLSLPCWQNSEINLWYVWLIILGFPWLFFSLLFEIFMNGQTPGKLAFKIKVVRLDGTHLLLGTI